MVSHHYNSTFNYISCKYWKTGRLLVASFSPLRELGQGRIYQMEQCRGAHAWMVRAFLVFTFIWQENATNIWRKTFFVLILFWYLPIFGSKTQQICQRYRLRAMSIRPWTR